jgi:L-fucose isomerase
MAKIGIVTFSDGRRYVHEPLVAENRSFQERLVRALVRGGHEVVAAEEIVWSNELARQEGERLARAGVDATIFNYAIWAFPQFTVMASRFAPGPYLLFGQVNPSKPGMVAVLAAAGALDQIGTAYMLIFGEIEDREAYGRVDAWAKAAHAARSLRGETYGLFGGRSIGINTAVANTDQWARQFGIDVEHIDQWEIVRRASEVDRARVRQAREWLERHVRKVHYDNRWLTPEKLETQIASYYAVREIIAER